MHTVLIVIHLLIVLALVGIVLVQKSEGGGLGIGGGSGFMTARGAANTLTRTTGILAAAFFATSLALGILARYGSGPTDILDRIPASQSSPTGKTDGTLLDKLNESSPKSSSEPAGQAAPAQANGAAAEPPSAPEGNASGNAPAGNQPAPSGQAPAGQETAPANGSGGSGQQVPTGQ